MRQSSHVGQVHAVLGVCYGKPRKNDHVFYTELIGKAFWEFLSDDPQLYIRMIEPLADQAEHQRNEFLFHLNETRQRFIAEFTAEYCDAARQINWLKLINSGESSQE